MSDDILSRIGAVIESRKGADPSTSYVAKLFDKGLDGILKKVGEEATETIVAAKNSDSGRFVSETGDLIYHLLVLLVERGVTLEEISKELKGRRK